MDKDIVAKVVGNSEMLPPDVAPGSLVTTTYAQVEEEIGDLAKSEEDVLMYALFPNEARTFLSKHRTSEKVDFLTELLKHTKPGAMKFFDINLRGDHYSKELIEELLKAATVFKINDEELLLLRDMFDIRGTSGEDASRWFIEEFGLDYVILTAGSAYSTIISRKGEVSTLDTPHVEVNDTVGAGDSFSGTFTARILLGDTLAEAHRKAVNTAAYVCTQAGAWPQYPAEMPDYLAEIGK